MMKQAGSDPFEEEPLPRTFYHPSQAKELSKRERGVCLVANEGLKNPMEKVNSPEDLKFLDGVNKLKIHEVPTRENGLPADSSSSQFNESWPSTDRTLSVGTPQSVISTPEMTQPMREWLKKREGGPTKSTLGWFINRFRNAPPTSRQHRDRAGLPSGSKGGDFWWLSPPSSSSTPLGDTPPQRLLSPHKSPKLTPRKGSSTLSSSIDIADKATSDLQKRATELLEKSETTLDSTISTEPFPNLVKPHLIQAPLKQTSVSQPETHIAYKQKRDINPENDILYQWRLARKMEQAQEKAGRTLAAAINPWKAGYQGRVGSDIQTMRGRQPRASDTGYTESRTGPEQLGNISNTQHKPSAPHLNDGNALVIGHHHARVPPHLHLSCDIIPCPHHDHGNQPRYTGNHDNQPRYTGNHDNQPMYTGNHDDQHSNQSRHPGNHDDQHSNQSRCPGNHGNLPSNQVGHTGNHGDHYTNQKSYPGNQGDGDVRHSFDGGIVTRESVQNQEKVDPPDEHILQQEDTAVAPPDSMQGRDRRKEAVSVDGDKEAGKQAEEDKENKKPSGIGGKSGNTDVLGSVISKVVSKHLFSEDQLSSSSDEAPLVSQVQDRTKTKSSTQEDSLSRSYDKRKLTKEQLTETKSSVSPEKGYRGSGSVRSSSRRTSDYQQHDQNGRGVDKNRGEPSYGRGRIRSSSQGSSSSRSDITSSGHLSASAPHMTSLLAESSDEEFSDDEILKVLRDKSQRYREKLREIDRLLNQAK
ncbi:uncharacterized protein LOC5510964 isoform X1 [Nematostella vectensis]|uniref:uncharacterized protein LOC5510964 isoform X1 n=1 Tax=Nematostella vectensis TaxID=45351 RepID=UPI00207797B0|nr:uncharacterized protein LOC5510964 isoform X1 [Nematostella vectensis]